MPASITHVTYQGQTSTARVEVRTEREGRPTVEHWRVAMREQLDFNGRSIGYRVWVSPVGAAHGTPEDALAAACQLIEALNAEMEPPSWAVQV